MLAMDLITTLLASIMVVYAILENQHLLVDIALALSALSFIATLGVGRYVSEGRVF
ncbi:MAG UNVERIFIED_CONTAM: monovalent cation/H+ antiporter complex subunit F [Anaerolineae bacterium]|jgi:multisubunit Na+/H+ antiporter MnhF subunit